MGPPTGGPSGSKRPYAGPFVALSWAGNQRMSSGSGT
jgi:hypothetical protein